MGDKENNVGEDPNLSIEMRDGDKNNNDDFTSRSHNNGGGSMDELEVAALQDHFTLFAPSSTVRFRHQGNAARVYENKTEQFVLEETRAEGESKSKITVKRMRDTTKSLQLLRVLYTIVCVLWTGFFFVFGLQVMLFLVLDLAVQSGYTEIQSDANVGAMIGVILAILGFVHGFSAAMVIACTFCADVWTGHYMAKQFFRLKGFQSDTAVDWLFFVFFLALPILVTSGAFFSGSDNWWHISALFYISCICVFFAAFSFSTVWYELRAALNFVHNGLTEEGTEIESWWTIVRRCILLVQSHHYSGKKRVTYMARSTFDSLEATEDIDEAEIFPDTKSISMSLWSRLTGWPYLSTETDQGPKLFRTLDPAKRLYTIDDVQDFRPFFTKHTWSLERVFCRPQDSRYIAIINGPSALTRSQIRSSIICSFIGYFLVIMLVVSFLVWMDLPGLLIAIVLFLMLFGIWRSTKNLRKFSKVAKELVDFRTELKDKQITLMEYWETKVKPKFSSLSPRFSNPDDPKEKGAVEVADGDAPGDVQVEDPPPEPEEESPVIFPSEQNQVVHGSLKSNRESIIALRVNNEASEGVFLVVEYKRFSQVTGRFCRWVTVFEIAIRFLFPLISLFIVGNWQVALLFMFVVGLSNIRHYINARTLIEETGNMDLVEGNTFDEKWANKARLSDIVENVTNDKSIKFWKCIMYAMGLIWIGILFSAIGSSTDSIFDQRFHFADEKFYYPPQQNDIRYPTCDMSSNGIQEFDDSASLADYAFLAGLPYKTDEIIKDDLAFFKNSDYNITYDPEFVEAYRIENDYDNAAVKFDLYRIQHFDDDKESAIVSIRGTHTSYDLLADLQLWSAAMLMQVVRAVLPLGGIWTPVFDELIFAISKFQSSSLEQISFYIVTTAFVNDIKEQGIFDSVQLTGHSLGGGLAIISGAQSKTPAVALSGPNAKISGKTFKPQVVEKDLNRYTFNIIPNRDPVPRFDDVADNFQNIRCNAAANNFPGCHDSTRSLCEIMYTCGSDNRPVPCECVDLYGFEEPISLSPFNGEGRDTFREECDYLYSLDDENEEANE